MDTRLGEGKNFRKARGFAPRLPEETTPLPAKAVVKKKNAIRGEGSWRGGVKMFRI
jgi:hypothetical protein